MKRSGVKSKYLKNQKSKNHNCEMYKKQKKKLQ